MHVLRTPHVGHATVGDILLVSRNIPCKTSMDLMHTVPWWTCREQDAQKFIAEHKIHAWLQMDNDQYSMAHTTRRASATQMGHRADYTLPNGMAPVSTCTPLSKRMKQWTRRWAKRFHLRRGCLPSSACADQVDVSEKDPQLQSHEEKKRTETHLKNAFGDPKTGPQNRPYSGHLFCATQ